jgi:hypothetical protein
MLPLNQISRSCFIDILRLRKPQSPTQREGRNTPMALAKMHENNTANMKSRLNFYDCIPYIPRPRYVNTKASAACPIVSIARVLLILLF